MAAVQHLDEEQLEQVAAIWFDFYADRGSGVDWMDFYSRVEDYMRIDLPVDTTHPVFRQIHQHLRQARREANQ